MVENVVLLAKDIDGDIIVISRKDDVLKFGLPGGKIEEGEEPIEALLREIEEELEYDLDRDHLQLVYSGSEGDSITHTYEYDLPIDLDLMYAYNGEGCYIDTVNDLEELTDPAFSPFWQYNTDLMQALNAIPS